MAAFLITVLLLRVFGIAAFLPIKSKFSYTIVVKITIFRG